MKDTFNTGGALNTGGTLDTGKDTLADRLIEECGASGPCKDDLKYSAAFRLTREEQRKVKSAREVLSLK